MTNPGAGTPTASRTLLIVASVIVVVAGLRAASDIIVPLLVALFLSLISFPVLFWLLGKRVPSGVAVATTILVDLAVLAGAGLIVTGSVNELTREVDKYRVRFNDYEERIERAAESASEWLEARGILTPSWFPRFEDLDSASQPSADPGSTQQPPEGASPATSATSETAASAGVWWLNLFDLDALLDVATGTVRGVATTLSNSLIVVLITTFVLLEAVTFRRKLRLAFGRGQAEERFERILGELRHYLGIKTAMSALTGTLIGIWLAILGIDFAMLWGLAAFLLNFIPSLGSIIAAIPTVLLAIVQQGVGPAILVALGYLAINVVLGNFVEPTLMGRRLGLSTLVVFLSLVFWGWVWGPIGMLLSVPLTMIVKILLENSQDFRWVAVLLGNVESESRQRRHPLRAASKKADELEESRSKPG